MSSEQKTPIISVSSTRKAIMYSFTRFVTCHEARMQIGIRKVVRITKGMEMPSTPSL